MFHLFVYPGFVHWLWAIWTKWLVIAPLHWRRHSNPEGVTNFEDSAQKLPQVRQGDIFESPDPGFQLFSIFLRIHKIKLKSDLLLRSQENLSLIGIIIVGYRSNHEWVKFGNFTLWLQGSKNYVNVRIAHLRIAPCLNLIKELITMYMFFKNAFLTQNFTIFLDLNTFVAKFFQTLTSPNLVLKTCSIENNNIFGKFRTSAFPG